MTLLLVPIILNELNPHNPIVKCTNFNRRPIKNCTPDYKIQLLTIGSDLIIGRRTFASIRGTIYSDTIDYLLCNQRKVNLSGEDTDKENGPQCISTDFIEVFYAAKTSTNILLLSLCGKLFLWSEGNGCLIRVYLNYQHITTVFLLQFHSQYVWI